MSETMFWRYSIPPVDNLGGWGIFLLDNTGMFCAVSDYGNYSFKWNAFNGDFRRFILGVEPDYIIRKLYLEQGRALWFNAQETEKNIKRYIIELRKEESLSKEAAREEWNLLNDYDFNNPGDFEKWMDVTGLDEAYEYADYDYPPAVKAFGYELLPRLKEEIKKEIESEAA